MLKKVAALATLGATIFSTAVFADGTSNNELSEIYSGGFTIGTGFDISFGITTPVLTLGYINECFLADIGYSYINLSVDSENQNLSVFTSHLGLRNQLHENLYVTYGVAGSASAGNAAESGRPWAAGAFLGLDLQITRHFLLSMKVNPYNFSSLSSSFKTNEIFASGSINLAYVF